MYNDNTELLKLVGLNQYDIDRDKTTIYVDISSNDISINLYLKRGICSCPYCKSSHVNVHARKVKNIYHPVI